MTLEHYAHYDGTDLRHPVRTRLLESRPILFRNQHQLGASEAWHCQVPERCLQPIVEAAVLSSSTRAGLLDGPECSFARHKAYWASTTTYCLWSSCLEEMPA